MSIELRIPALGESITDVEIGGWLKGQGEPVRKDEPLVSLESEKATVELPAPDSGTLSRILKQKGEVAKVGEIIAYLDKDGQAGAGPGAGSRRARSARARAGGKTSGRSTDRDAGGPTRPGGARLASAGSRADGARRAHAQGRCDPPRGTIPPATRRGAERARRAARSAPCGADEPGGRSFPCPGRPRRPGREEETVPMSRLRRTVAERLVEAQNTAALLTTFNEIDMSGILALRKEYGDAFQRKYNVKLGFMSFFVKACVDALKQFPVLNAEVRGTNIVYHNYYDIGVAIGSGKGLVVPVLRNAERLSFAEVERAIGDFARRARENKLKLDELQGGTFTISNGGVYGSMLSTPIINPPQSGVLGMHAIQERPVAREGNVLIRPIMYVALTYDHRIVDGREAVSFLKHIREVIENPARMLMEI